MRNASHNLGLATVPTVGCGWIAYVLWDRVRSFARAEGVPASIVLGSVIAHEIGHLLLGNAPHAADGIMRAQLQGRDFLAVRDGASANRCSSLAGRLAKTTGAFRPTDIG